MEIPPILKKTPVLIGGIILVVVIIVIGRRSSGASSGSGTAAADSYSQQVAATQQANIQIAGLNAATEQAKIRAGVDLATVDTTGRVSLSSIEAQKVVALSKIGSDENVNLQMADYQYDVANKQLENNRVLGLTAEDTKRLISTQENDTRLKLGITALDSQRFIATRSIESTEIQQARDLAYKESQLNSQERIADLSSSRALTYATVAGQQQVAAIKAAKPSAFSGFLSNLGKGIGGGLSTFLGGL